MLGRAAGWLQGRGSKTACYRVGVDKGYRGRSLAGIPARSGEIGGYPYGQNTYAGGLIRYEPGRGKTLPSGLGGVFDEYRIRSKVGYDYSCSKDTEVRNSHCN